MAAKEQLESFASWIEQVIRDRGYDIDSPRGGGKSRLADAAGIHRAAITRLLQRHSMPDLETLRRLARVLRVPVRDMLIRSGQLTPAELPPNTPEDAETEETGSPPLTLERAAVLLGIPVDQREIFVRVAAQFMPETGDTASESARRAN
ncbi:helix-turn-helix transcriptional regulator [Streptomyces sp. N2-109]|uniref:Helix-turn-helix transcriptional regulator n=1 Tax=Streptomyces gossypii TaxID=2883101 RepID=A0ABT2JXU5_9ACTN|nr:helix-turn-helix transcriptional regulator [Streptomyces gossypii]MCT2592724.1 helix-turn-helix transcriptional regulator [Streptomyces gossypii]